MIRNNWIVRFVVLVSACISLPCLAADNVSDELLTSVSGIKIELLTEKDIRLTEAESLIRKEQYVDAILLIEDIVKADVRTDKAYTLAAYAYIKLGKLDKARQTLVNALRLSPRSRAAQNYSGRLALLEEEPKDAQRNLNALKAICGGTDCLEYRDLEYRIKEFELEQE